jgi:hypothetical protein
VALKETVTEARVRLDRRGVATTLPARAGTRAEHAAPRREPQHQSERLAATEHA